MYNSVTIVFVCLSAATAKLLNWNVSLEHKIWMKYEISGPMCLKSALQKKTRLFNRICALIYHSWKLKWSESLSFIPQLVLKAELILTAGAIAALFFLL